ncbi:MAG: DUF1349 domain-containing protein [Spirochaetes bacterium]|nr:DUF1349 domain-containing protein [Spirochaetota bacterium]
MNIDFSNATWRNRPKSSEIIGRSVKITTEPDTDLWQRSYYGFRNDTAPALLLDSEINFTFTTRASFHYRARFDQCGVLVYLDNENWFKASMEYEDETISRLGSVVTNYGYSDWATVDVHTTTVMWYRLSRRGPDFLVESSPDGTSFTQMRIFHVFLLGETSAEMGMLDPPAPPDRPVRFGLYACSPSNSSFEAVFDNFSFAACEWKAHGTA